MQIHWFWVPFSCMFTLWIVLETQSRMFSPPSSIAAKEVQSCPLSSPSYAEAVSRAAPAVVNIFSTQTIERRAPVSFQNPYLLGRYGHLPNRPRRQRGTSLGSGVIFRDAGVILTNRHIVDQAGAIRVELADGRAFDAQVLGTDPETDLAVLRVQAEGLPVLSVGKPQALRVGDVVLAIGNAYGMGQTVTLGIVSATGRSQLGITAIENFIQTDASINPGNSGGALINAAGEVVGINTAIVSQSGGSEGIGFAIPIDLALRIAQEIMTQGKATHGWIGIEGRTVNPSLAENFGLQVSQGVLVDRTLAQSPADRAGIRPGDVITRIDQQPVLSVQELHQAIVEAGESMGLSLQVWRGSDSLYLEVITRPSP